VKQSRENPQTPAPIQNKQILHFDLGDIMPGKEIIIVFSL
jgi:hypothetical protein